jgi:hypothetical protein
MSDGTNFYLCVCYVALRRCVRFFLTQMKKTEVHLGRRIFGLPKFRWEFGQARRCRWERPNCAVCDAWVWFWARLNYGFWNRSLIPLTISMKGRPSPDAPRPSPLAPAAATRWSPVCPNIKNVVRSQSFDSLN